MNETENILGAFCLIKDIRILSQEEFEDVKEAIQKIIFSNKKLNEQLEENEWKINELANMVAERSNIFYDSKEVIQEVNKKYFSYRRE